MTCLYPVPMGRRRGSIAYYSTIGMIGLSALIAHTGSSYAASIDIGDPDTKIRWDNTFKYSAAVRTRDQSSKLTANKNLDDGDRNFDKGLISNRGDWLTELDLVHKGFGFRVSAAAWYDTEYHGDNDHDSPSTTNNVSAAYNGFTDKAMRLHGGDAELLDAFVFGKGYIGDMKGSFRAGRHTVLWGESLFFGANGIAGTQSPVDVVKAVSVPSSEFKEIIRPVNQLSGQLRVADGVTVGAYYQLEWEETRLPAAGSYFSRSDIIGDGAERLWTGTTYMERQDDVDARDSGQGGIKLSISTDEVDYGFYAINFHAKTPNLYTNTQNQNFAVGKLGEYYWVYPEDIRAYGASFSTTLENYNIAGEASMRTNTPLISTGQTATPATADNDSNPAYAVGKTLHANLSMLATLEPSMIANEASLVGEVAWNRVLGTTKNLGARSQISDRDALGMRVSYEPSYRQVLPGLNLSVPVSASYFPQGKSSVIDNFGPDNGGDVTFGVSGTYDEAWQFGLSYTHYYGPEAAFLNSGNDFNMQQDMADRNFVSFNVRRTF